MTQNNPEKDKNVKIFQFLRFYASFDKKCDKLHGLERSTYVKNVQQPAREIAFQLAFGKRQMQFL